MNALLIACVLLVGQKKDDVVQEVAKDLPYQADFSYLEKTYGLKTRNFMLYERGGTHKITFLAEFDHNLSSEQLADVKEMFTPTVGKKVKNPRQNKIRLVWTDLENVVVYSHNLESIHLKGEITGIKGDAFRVSLEGISALGLEGATKMQARPLVARKPDEKKQDKP